MGNSFPVFLFYFTALFLILWENKNWGNLKTQFSSMNHMPLGTRLMMQQPLTEIIFNYGSSSLVPMTDMLSNFVIIKP